MSENAERQIVRAGTQPVTRQRPATRVLPAIRPKPAFDKSSVIGYQAGEFTTRGTLTVAAVGAGGILGILVGSIDAVKECAAELTARDPEPEPAA